MTNKEQKVIEECVKLLNKDGVNTKAEVRDKLTVLLNIHRTKWN